MAGSGGPWGGGGGPNDDDRNGGRDSGKDRGGRRPGEGGPQIPEIEEIMKKGQEQLRVLMGGRGRGNFNGGGNGGGRDPNGPLVTGRGVALGALAAVAVWGWMSFYTVDQPERSVELFLGEFSGIGEPGLNFAPWPFVTAEVLPVFVERQTDVGGVGTNQTSGLMVTRDQNIVDIGFQVVWNISDPAKYVFNIADPEDTIRAVSESAMRDIIARSELAPILNRDRGAIAADLRKAVQTTLDGYGSGINIVRVNLQQAAPPADVIDSFRAVQAAQQERDRLEKEADKYANQVTAGARGEAARVQQDAEAYRAQVVNEAQGEASRFDAIYQEYVKAPDVTRKRMYLETMEKVLGGMNKVILDGVASGQAGGQGVVPYLPLNELAKPATGATSTGGSN